MARRSKAMDERELIAQLDGQISDARAYAGSELSEHRERALKYYDADMSKDLPARDGKSSVVSQDVADTIGWLLPGLMRVFLAAEHVGIYEPEKPGDEEFAKQATDYVNYVLLKECDGYSTLRSAMFDGLLLGNGILKHWWDETPEYCTEDFSGLPEASFIDLVSDDTIEVLEHTEYEAPLIVPMMEPTTLHDVKIKRMTRSGRLMIRVVPGEDFGIERDATAINENDCLFCYHRDTPTRSELISRGYDRAVVDDLSRMVDTDDDEKSAREPMRKFADADDGDHSADRVEVFECYVKVDYDGDGVAEWRQVVIAADSGEKRVLSNEEWGDDLPFTDLVPDPVPHRWRGRSIFDEVGEVQKVKTSLLRRMLDNLYMTLEPNRAVWDERVKNPDALIDLKLGDTIRTDGDPNTIIRDLTVPFVGKEAAPMLEYWDQVAERRTGVGNRSAGLDKDTLQNEPTATATNAMQAVSQSKQEDYARNIAEVGMKRLFRSLLKLMVKHQDQPRIIRLRDQWVDMDPRAWNANMDVSINVGLGSGSRDRDLQMLSGILMNQKEILMQMGPLGPLVTIQEFRNTLAKMVEVAGIKTPEQFFKEITPEVMQSMQEQASQPKPDPKMAEAQAKLQIAQMTAQSDAQLAQQRAMAEAQLSQARNQADVQLARDKAGADIEAQREAGMLKLQLMREEAGAKIQLAREEAQVKAQLRREEMMLEAELTAQANAMNAQVAARQADTNINRPGGE